MADPEVQDLLKRGYRYALSLCHDPARAEDLAQEAWASMLSAGGRRDKPYLFRAIRSRWIDAHRRRQVLSFEPLARPADLADDRTDPRDVDRAALQRAMATLRPQEREALYLCVVEGYSATEAAELMGCPRNTVLSLAHRGRARLRAWFASQTQQEAL